MDMENGQGMFLLAQAPDERDGSEQRCCGMNATITYQAQQAQQVQVVLERLGARPGLSAGFPGWEDADCVRRGQPSSYLSCLQVVTSVQFRLLMENTGGRVHGRN
ncbi:hypothetical protein VTJ04DRAFT_10733 [Mycothermus thermophilus]|uniref:uncharacterized protein n=1 Tax=Humicola insolens TaxID=85995 RepID=UPI00374496C3